jgi:hypothetical protein
MAAPLTSDQIAALLEVGHRKVFFEKIGSFKSDYPTLFNVLGSTKSQETDRDVGSMGLFSKRTQGADLTYDSVAPGPDATYVHEEWAMGYQVTQITLEDDQYGVSNKLAGLLGPSAMETIEREVASDFNNGFDTAYPGGDGKPLFSATHWQPGGVDLDNLMAAADFAVDSLEQGLIDVGSYVDGRGKKKHLMVKRMIHPLESAWLVETTLNSVQLPGNNFNDVNAARGKVTPYMYRYLTDPDSWYLQCEGHEMNVFMRRKPDFGRDNDFGTSNLRFKSTFRLSHGWSRAQEMWGSAGG